MNHRFNNLDDLIINQGYMSQRTKSPYRPNNPNINNNHNIVNNINRNYQNNEPYSNHYQQNNKSRDISPTKIVNKSKPFLNQINQQNNQQNNRIPLTNNIINYPQQQTQNIINNDIRGHLIQQNIQNNKNIQTKNLQNNQNSQHIPTKNIQNTQNIVNKNIQTKNLQNLHSAQNIGQKNIKSPRSAEVDTNFVLSHGGVINCQNHGSKKADYMTETDGEVIYYCETCAAKLAAQRFQVIRLANYRQTFGNNKLVQRQRSRVIRKRRQLPCISKHKNNPVYESIIEFLKQIFSVQEYHFETHQELERVEQHYDNQIEMVDEFYNQLMQILEKMHQDHVCDLQSERRKHSQMKDIYQNEIYENLETIEQIINDLDQNFQTVVNKITHQDIQFFNQALDKNRSNIRFFCNQIEQQREMFNDLTNYNEQRLMNMINQFQNSLVQLWTDPPHHQKPPIQKINQLPLNQNNSCPQKSSKHAFKSNNGPESNALQQKNRSDKTKGQQEKINLMQMHQNQQKTGLLRDFEGKGACRQIFEDEDDESLTQQVSPKFKNI